MYNKEEVGKRIKEFRKARGYSQDNMCKIFGVKDISTISRYENGTLIPTIEQIINFCDELDISIGKFFDDDTNIFSRNTNLNPFNTKTLYIYYNGFNKEHTKTEELTFKIDFENKEKYIAAYFKDINTDEVYSTGLITSNDSIAIIDLRNYEGHSLKLSFGLITIDVSRHKNGMYRGDLHASDDNFKLHNRKCIVSKYLLDWNDDIRKELIFSDEEKNKLHNTNIMDIDIDMNYDY